MHAVGPPMGGARDINSFMNDGQQPEFKPSVTQIWAKTDSKTGQWHPLLCHMIETSAVASVLWDEILAPGTRDVIADALGLPVDEARQWSLFLAGVHDLGKASPSFQRSEEHTSEL